MKVKILQGPSGAGKSTYAKNLLGKVYVCSADHFFENEQGEYAFDSSKLSEAHGWCLKRYLTFITPPKGVEQDWGADWTIVVDNTNTTALEIAPYYQAALAFQHDVEIVIFEVDPGVAQARNVHQVPISTVKSQSNRIRDSKKNFPRWWKHRIFEEK